MDDLHAILYILFGFILDYLKFSGFSKLDIVTPNAIDFKKFVLYVVIIVIFTIINR